MVKGASAIILMLGIAQAACPSINLEDFDKTLHSDQEEITIKGSRYSITTRTLPGYTLESQSKPSIMIEPQKVKGKDSCKYTRRLGDEDFGTFTLRPIKKPKKASVKEGPKTVIIERTSEPRIIYERPPAIVYQPQPFTYGGPVIIEGEHHHHRHHHH